MGRDSKIVNISRHTGTVLGGEIMVLVVLAVTINCLLVPIDPCVQL